MRLLKIDTSERRKPSMPHCRGVNVCSDCTMGGGGTLSRVGATPIVASAVLISYCYSYCQSGSSGCFTSQSGRRLCTTGMVGKLYAGGGEVVVHSSVQPSHGSSPAGFPLRSETIR